MKLGLGTVQFGQDYGISNKSGKTGKDEVVRILEAAKESGVSVVDTAALYGDSEEVLGECLAALSDTAYKVVTKTPHFFGSKVGGEDVSKLLAVFHRSLTRLRLKGVYGLLIHNADDLLKPGGFDLYAEMQNLKAAGLVQKIGVSVYSPEQLAGIAEKVSLDLVQLPLNIFDQRFLRSEVLAQLKSEGVEIHVRSAFLQGLLLMDTESLNPYFESIKPLHADFHKLCMKEGVTPLEASLQFVSSLDCVDVVVCGVNSLDQFSELLESSSGRIDPDVFSSCSVSDLSVIEPSRWSFK
ncbi:aldo/keto reductase [bacterium SCSIO 12696]|nr:aldo/keto reductase [bacterium SCSIO 12696]